MVKLSPTAEKWFCAKFNDANSDRKLYINYVKDSNMEGSSKCPTEHGDFLLMAEIARANGQPIKPWFVRLSRVNGPLCWCKDNPENLVINAYIGTKNIPPVRWDSNYQKVMTAVLSGTNLDRYFLFDHGISPSFRVVDPPKLLKHKNYVEPGSETREAYTNPITVSILPGTNLCAIIPHFSTPPDVYSMPSGERLVEFQFPSGHMMFLRLPFDIKPTIHFKMLGVLTIFGVVKSTDLVD